MNQLFIGLLIDIIDQWSKTLTLNDRLTAEDNLSDAAALAAHGWIQPLYTHTGWVLNSQMMDELVARILEEEIS